MEQESAAGHSAYVFNEKKKKKSCRESFAPYVISPFNKWKILADLIMGLIYLMTYMTDPYILCFLFTPLSNPNINQLQRSLTFIMLVDMISNFVTGIPREDAVYEDDKKDKKKKKKKDGEIKSKKESLRKKNRQRKGNASSFINKGKKDLTDPLLQRDIRVLAVRYFKREAWFDIFANFPIIVYLIVNGYPQSEEEIDNLSTDVVFISCMALKTLRLYHVKEVTDAFRRLIDKLADIFYLKRYLFVNFQSWTLASIKFLMTVHYFSCGWILIANIKTRMGLNSNEFQ